MWRRLGNVHVLLHVRASGDSPVSLAMTHRRQLHGQSGHESTDCTRSVVHCVGGWKTWHINMCSSKDAGRSERETSTPCEFEQVVQDFHPRYVFSQRGKEHSMWKSHVGSFSNDSLSFGRLCHDAFWFVFCLMIRYNSEYRNAAPVYVMEGGTFHADTTGSFKAGGTQRASLLDYVAKHPSVCARNKPLLASQRCVNFPSVVHSHLPR